MPAISHGGKVPLKGPCVVQRSRPIDRRQPNAGAGNVTNDLTVMPAGAETLGRIIWAERYRSISQSTGSEGSGGKPWIAWSRIVFRYEDILGLMPENRATKDFAHEKQRRRRMNCGSAVAEPLSGRHARLLQELGGARSRDSRLGPFIAAGRLWRFGGSRHRRVVGVLGGACRDGLPKYEPTFERHGQMEDACFRCIATMRDWVTRASVSWNRPALSTSASPRSLARTFCQSEPADGTEQPLTPACTGLKLGQPQRVRGTSPRFRSESGYNTSRLFGRSGPLGVAGRLAGCIESIWIT